jgi:hypothetical protein
MLLLTVATPWQAAFTGIPNNVDLTDPRNLIAGIFFKIFLLFLLKKNLPFLWPV